MRQKLKKYGKLFSYRQVRYGADNVFINGVCVDKQGQYKYSKGEKWDLDTLKKILLGDIIIDEAWNTIEKPEDKRIQSTLLMASAEKPMDELAEGASEACQLFGGC